MFYRFHHLTFSAALGFWMVLLACVGLARAGTTAVFDFEGQPVTTGTGLTALTLSNNGLSMTISRGGQSFDMANLSALGGTSAFGARTLAPTPPGTNPFSLDFSQPLSSFSAQMGDFSAALTDQLTMTAFSGPNGTGAKLGTSSASLVMTDASTLAFKTLAINGTGIKSIEVTGGATAGENSVFYDNFSATFAGGSTGAAVPLPPAIFVAPLGAALAWLAARKLRSVSHAC